ncbi:hypothetical protein [Clostridium felsineum]|uniref:Uncharacterized protein n=1 Tax=Clostridium felsineum TaxID=36839 RepID=A0A1S8LDH0_9CLOT|nr:hypothetical protein [Clostridium felsineum]URZ05925.1 hypothetical protein CLROS_012570 [Clostridium felsineum]URZ10962.1 hypothetical protein CROST_016780 [Clostridium felsineum]
MLESAKVVLSLKELDSLRQEGESFRNLAKEISHCCNINYDEYNETGNVQDTKIIVNKKRLEKIVRDFSCWGKDDEIETDEVKFQYK